MDVCGQEWLVNDRKLDVFGMKLPSGFQLIGQVVRILLVRVRGQGQGS